MDPSKRQGIDGSQLSSTSRSAFKTSMSPNNLNGDGDSGYSKSFIEGFLFPFIAESNRTYQENFLLSLFCGFWCTVTVYIGCTYDLNSQNVPEFVTFIKKIIFCGFDGTDNRKTMAFTAVLFINLIMLGLFIYTYVAFRFTFEFNKFSKILMKYVFGCLSSTIIYVTPIHFFASLSELGKTVSAESVLTFLVSCVMQVSMVLFTKYILMPVLSSPYITQESAFLWNAPRFLHIFYMYALSFSLQYFVSVYKHEYGVLPPIIGIFTSISLFLYGWSLQPKKKSLCMVYMASGVSFGTSCVLGIVTVFKPLSPLIVYVMPLGIFAVAALISTPLVMMKTKRIVKELSYEAIEENELKTDEEKFEYFDTLNINSTDKGFTYLIIGLENASPLFLDFSLTKYLLEKFPDDNTLLIIQTWFVSFFPNEQMIMHTLISRINKMVKPNPMEQLMRYQLHRVHIFRQSSASREANADLAKVRALTDSVVAENCRFWANAAMPHSDIKPDFHRKLTAIRQKAEAGWVEIIDKYPNNARFAAEYSRFLIEGTCEFKEGIKWYHKAIKIESGKKRETDQMFKIFVMSYPFYLKKRIVNTSGNINLKALVHDTHGNNGENMSTISESANHSSTKDTSSLNSSLSADDDSDSAIDLQESEKALPQAQLRLAFESAVRSIKSKSARNTVISASIKFIVVLIIGILLFFIISTIFTNSEKTINNTIAINNVQRFFNAAGFHSFWYTLDFLRPFDKEKIKSIFGDNLYKTSIFTNISEPDMPKTFRNLTSILNNNIDIMSSDIYLQGLEYQSVKMFADLFINTDYKSDMCMENSGFVIRLPNIDNTTVDKLLRTYLFQALRFSTNERGTQLLTTKVFCDLYCNYLRLQDMADDFLKNRSVLYTNEINHILNYVPDPNNPDDRPTSIYLGDNVTNFQPSQVLVNETVPDESITYITSITDAFMAFTPFLVLFASMPSVIFLTAVLQDEIKHVRDILVSMPPNACKEASTKIQKGTIEGKKSSLITTQAGTDFPFYIITLIDAIIVIAIVILCSLYAQNVTAKGNTFLSHINLFMELRNLFSETAYLTMFSVLTVQNELENVPTQYGEQKFFLPYLNFDEMHHRIHKDRKRINLIQGIIDTGDDVVQSALGLTKEIDDARFNPECIQEADTNISFNFYRCLSFDRACAFYIAKLVEIVHSLQHIELDSDELYNFAMLYNAKILPGFDKVINTYEQCYHKELHTFRTRVMIYSFIVFLVGLISFFVEISVLKSIKEMQKSVNTVMLRLNPIQFVQNQAAAALIVGEDDSDESKIVSAAHAVFFTAGDAMILLNNEGIIEKLNPAATSIFHFTPEQMLGQHSTIILPKDNQKNQQLYYTMQLMSSGQSGLVYETELEGVRDDGTKVPINATMIGFASDQRNAEVFAIMCKDQTEEVKQKQAVEIAKKQSDDLLLKILPPDIIRRINRGEKDIAIVVPSASIIFIDICQFSAYMATLSASQLMCNLNAVFTAYDKIVADLPLITKIKLIGDDYMAAAGLFSPDEPPKMHAIQMITFGLRVLDAIEDLNEQLNASLMVRIGVNSGGPIIAGVLGTDKPLFDIIGDTINVASRLQSTDIPGNVQISKGTYELVAAENRFNIEERGEIFLKGKGNQTTYLVSAKTTEVPIHVSQKPVEEQKPAEEQKVIEETKIEEEVIQI